MFDRDFGRDAGVNSRDYKTTFTGYRPCESCDFTRENCLTYIKSGKNRKNYQENRGKSELSHSQYWNYPGFNMLKQRYRNIMHSENLEVDFVLTSSLVNSNLSSNLNAFAEPGTIMLYSESPCTMILEKKKEKKNIYILQQKRTNFAGVNLHSRMLSTNFRESRSSTVLFFL